MIFSTPNKKQNPHQNKNQLFGVLLTSIFLTSIPVFFPTPALSQSNRRPLGRQLFQAVIRCVEKKIPSPRTANQTRLQSVAVECVTKEVMLDRNGKLRPDANQRLASFVEATGFKLPPRIAKGQATIALGYLTDSKLFTIPVKIGNTNKTFLLDTGAGRTIINSQLAQQLGLKPTPVPPGILEQAPVIGNNLSQVSASIFTLPSLSVSSTSVTNLYTLGLPSTSLPDNLDGILGLDFLSNFDVIINPKNQQIQLLKPSKPVNGAIPLRSNFGVLIAQVYINDQGPFNMIVDTGATTMILSKDLAQQLKINLNTAEQEYVLGVGGLAKVKAVTLRKVQLQQHQAADLDAYVLDNSNIFKIPGIQGLIGQNFLNQYRQHWRFGKPNALGVVESGTLVLTPL